MPERPRARSTPHQGRTPIRPPGAPRISGDCRPFMSGEPARRAGGVALSVNGSQHGCGPRFPASAYRTETVSNPASWGEATSKPYAGRGGAFGAGSLIGAGSTLRRASNGSASREVSSTGAACAGALRVPTKTKAPERATGALPGADEAAAGGFAAAGLALVPPAGCARDGAALAVQPENNLNRRACASPAVARAKVGRAVTSRTVLPSVIGLIPMGSTVPNRLRSAE
jgi:hypothetical protein